jgi:DNA polymerase III subunit gamma/tau
MSYLVLARKWRPRSFSELVGQEHVLRALVNALESGRVHHAFLFTGTRGVGKTTIARILAKSLNCETGVSPRPCGQCSACREIDEGRFVDMIEVDAASRTKVDDTRELLDNVQYLPARGRYKVYLIDEVHMLSAHSFNALLKTLEEPPPHVKFLLATTDPQKLPVTVLSRCLQFNLKRLPSGLIGKRLTEIMQAEKIEAEPEALRLVAKAAEGSMRDALSLLDQVIAFGGARVSTADTRAMLGTVDHSQIVALLEALAARDGRRVLEVVRDMDEHVPDYRDALNELAALLQRIAIVQTVPDWEAQDDEDVEVLKALAGSLTPEDAQLYYQIALLGRRDLELAPDPRAGFEMALLRMLAFQRDAGSVVEQRAPMEQHKARPESAVSSPAITAANRVPPVQGAAAATDWSGIVAQLGLQGMASQLAAHCTLIGRQGGRVRLKLDADGEPFRRPALEEKLAQALSTHFGELVKLEFEVGQGIADTPARRRQAEAEDRQQAARQSIELDPNVRAMQDMFGAVVQPESVKPLGRET